MSQALDYYLKAETYYLYFERTANAEARRLYAKAADLDPDFARAHSDLAYAMLHAWLFNWDTGIDIAEIHDRALMGRDKDKDGWYGQWVLADVLLYMRDFDEARSAHELARSLAEKQAIEEDLRAVNADWADFLLLTGHPEQALTILQDVFSVNRPPEKWFHWVHGWALYLDNKCEESLAAFGALHNPRNAIRKNLVANHAGIYEAEKDKDPVKAQQHQDQAKQQAAKFLQEEKEHGTYYAPPGDPVLPAILALEQRIPFEIDEYAVRWAHHLSVGFDDLVQP